MTSECWYRQIRQYMYRKIFEFTKVLCWQPIVMALNHSSLSVTTKCLALKRYLSITIFIHLCKFCIARSKLKCTIGFFDVEFRLIVCTRTHEVFIIKRYLFNHLRPTSIWTYRNIRGEFNGTAIYIREHPFDVIFCANQV